MNPVNPKKYNFCPVCGASLLEKYITEEHTNRLVCKQCDFIFYQNPVPAVAVILQNKNEILLVKRKYPPRIGDWTLPAGFMEYDEVPKETAIRETKEETNLDIIITGLFDIFPAFDDARAHVVLIVYRAKILGGDLSPGDDASDVSFFSMNDLPENIAFSAHREVLATLADLQKLN